MYANVSFIIIDFIFMSLCHVQIIIMHVDMTYESILNTIQNKLRQQNLGVRSPSQESRV